jgi:uncharacterized membrane protein YgaE (UPF0421/DUF939 family)
MKKNEALLALIAIIPTCLTAYLGYRAKLAETTKKEALRENYSSYIEDQLRRDEAILQYLERCRQYENLHMELATTASDLESNILWMKRKVQDTRQQADAVLDALAKKEGWSPSE